LKTIEIDLPKGTEVKKYFENDGLTLYWVNFWFSIFRPL